MTPATLAVIEAIVDGLADIAADCNERLDQLAEEA